MKAAANKGQKRADARRIRFNARQAAERQVRRPIGWARGAVGADTVDDEVKRVLVALFAEGDRSRRRKWSGEEALEYLKRLQTDGRPRFPYARLPTLLGIKSVFSRGKDLMKTLEGGGQPSRRKRWTPKEDDIIKQHILQGGKAKDLAMEGRSKSAINVRMGKIKREMREEGSLVAGTKGRASRRAVPSSDSVQPTAALAPGRSVSPPSLAPAVVGSRRGQPWAPWEDEYLKEQLRNGVAASAIPPFGRSRAAIQQRCRKLRKQAQEVGSHTDTR